MTAVALSPGLDYRGVTTDDAVGKDGALLLVASHGDAYSAESIEQLFALVTGDVAARLYAGDAHGTQLFDNELESVRALVAGWLTEQVEQTEQVGE